MSSRISVALDGPSGVGKSTLARLAGQKLGLNYFDTGALYRSVGWYAASKGVDLTDGKAVSKILEELDITVSWNSEGIQEVYVNGRETSDVIRTPEASQGASTVAALPAVREFLLDTQRNVAKEQSVIVDGRDIGKVILPEATVKVFLTAKLEERARRRYLQLMEKGTDITEAQVLMEVGARDESDISKSLLCRADDAILLDSTDLNQEETLNKLVDIIKSGVKKKGLTL